VDGLEQGPHRTSRMRRVGHDRSFPGSVSQDRRRPALGPRDTETALGHDQGGAAMSAGADGSEERALQVADQHEGHALI